MKPNPTDKPVISFVIPLYNEEEIFHMLITRLNNLIQALSFPVEVILVDDGSTDQTAERIIEIAKKDGTYKGIILSRNFGHQLALTAGLNYVEATDAVMILDGDLQDPPELITKFYEQYKQGYDVVYAIRKKRKETVFKKFAYHLFYRILDKISYIKIPMDSGDFSLISRKVVDVLNSMPEESRYIRGMRTWIGFKQIGIEYERDSRAGGTSKYSIKQLFRLAYNGIFNFSETPVKFITRLGTLTIIVSLAYFFYTLYRKIFFNDIPQGFTALIFAIILFSGVQLISLGIIGEYVLRIFFQVKKRPLFIVKKTLINKEEKDGQ